MKHYIYKGNRPSEGAVQLKNALDGVLLRSEGSAYRGRAETCVINWGSYNAEAYRLAGIAPRIFNHPDAIKLVANKLTFFRKMKEVMPDFMVPFCETFGDALEMTNAGGRVFARKELNGHSGSGIHLMVDGRTAEIEAVRKVRRNNLMPVFISNEELVPEDLRNCKLFTQGVTGARTEFRVHVVNGQFILTQVKLRREGHDENPAYNTVVRNVDSGWVYGVNNIEGVQGVGPVRAAAIEAVRLMGLDFGAVDLVYKEDSRKVYVLEINTAPGLAEEGSALTAYTNAFKEVQ